MFQQIQYRHQQNKQNLKQDASGGWRQNPRPRVYTWLFSTFFIPSNKQIYQLDLVKEIHKSHKRDTFEFLVLPLSNLQIQHKALKYHDFELIADNFAMFGALAL